MDDFFSWVCQALSEHMQNLAVTTWTSCDNEDHILTVHSIPEFPFFLLSTHPRELDIMFFVLVLYYSLNNNFLPTSSFNFFFFISITSVLIRSPGWTVIAHFSHFSYRSWLSHNLFSFHPFQGCDVLFKTEDRELYVILWSQEFKQWYKDVCCSCLPFSASCHPSYLLNQYKELS